MTTTLPLPMPHSQRLRFIRSMKKLGDLLTETQSVLAVADGVAAGHRRAASSFSHASESTTPTTGTNTSFLSFRLPKSPLSLNPRPAPSPATPLTPAAIDPAKLQAHNLAKASAMLGEDVPPELVPFSQRNQQSLRTKGRKRSSTVSVPEFSTAAAAAVNVDLDASAGRVARDRRSHTGAHAHPHGKTQAQAPRPRPSRPTLKLKHAASSASLQSSLYERDADAEPFSYATLVAASTTVPVPVLFAPAPAQTDGRTTYRKEAAWSGEWSGSVRSMEDVVRGLRELRA
uniref:Uncharacterized protein n=1 Tax=Mycena chlorophos TaxID=658473 RepID=A0ABQ0L3P1_MYCCL|nr:predicted protein [Mycena chlorophos]